MGDIESDLKQNVRDFLTSAKEDYSKGRYNPCISNYFKAMSIICDCAIFKERRSLPKNHTERFQILERYFKDAYRLLSPIFSKYRDTYNLRLAKNDAEEISENADRLKKILGFEE